MRPIKKLTKKILNRFGFDIVRLDRKPAPAPVYEDLYEAFRKRNSGKPAAFRCPIDKAIILNGFSFSFDSWHPFVAESKRLLSSSIVNTYPDSLLKRYYERWAPENALQALIGAVGPECLSRYPAYTMHNPWLDISPSERQAVMENIIRHENRALGGQDLHASEGYGLQGPVSDRKGHIEHQRLVRTLESIRSNGYDRILAGQDITVVAIKRADDFRFCVAHGQHRMAALAALAYPHIATSIIQIVDIDDAKHWPMVYKGIWSVQETRAYIDHLFDFDGAQWARSQGLTDN